MVVNLFQPYRIYLKGLVYPVFFFLFFFPPATQAQQKSSTFTARLINLESTTKDPFRFNASLFNGSSSSQIFKLTADVPDGWVTLFRTEGSQVSAVKLDSDKTQDISIEITPSPLAKPGKYDIPVTAVGSGDSLRLNLEAVVKGNYAIQLTTPTGRLSDDVTEGGSRQIQLTVKNTGTLPLDGIDITAQAPSQWSATFAVSKIERLDAGQSQDITATLKVPEKTIAGDYITTFTARNSFANADAAFRITVKTSLLSGWVGILVIILAGALVYYLIRKYGRR